VRDTAVAVGGNNKQQQQQQQQLVSENELIRRPHF
jgi:hypothetical protein